MKKIIILMTLSFFLTGCSVNKVLVFAAGAVAGYVVGQNIEHRHHHANANASGGQSC
ncbi:MAG: hypothetical protein Nk1A_6670 [Endomicrobiia bacterium]|nr:MAG: hypothetical protein Nk1A_6670 [Endomicrobiia bacterium]